MKLSEMPFDKLKIGDKIISAIGTDGEIIDLSPEGSPCYFSHHARFDVISINWQNGNESHIYHMNGDNIEFVGQENI